MGARPGSVPPRPPRRLPAALGAGSRPFPGEAGRGRAVGGLRSCSLAPGQLRAVTHRGTWKTRARTQTRPEERGQRRPPGTRGRRWAARGRARSRPGLRGSRRGRARAGGGGAREAEVVSGTRRRSAPTPGRPARAPPLVRPQVSSAGPRRAPRRARPRRTAPGENGPRGGGRRRGRARGCVRTRAGGARGARAAGGGRCRIAAFCLLNRRFVRCKNGRRRSPAHVPGRAGPPAAGSAGCAG